MHFPILTLQLGARAEHTQEHRIVALDPPCNPSPIATRLEANCRLYSLPVATPVKLPCDFTLSGRLRETREAAPSDMAK